MGDLKVWSVVWYEGEVGILQQHLLSVDPLPETVLFEKALKHWKTK